MQFFMCLFLLLHRIFLSDGLYSCRKLEIREKSASLNQFYLGGTKNETDDSIVTDIHDAPFRS